MGSDPKKAAEAITQGTFQSTLPAWGATLRRTIDYATQEISIHAPRMGSDLDIAAQIPRQL